MTMVRPNFYESLAKQGFSGPTEGYTKNSNHNGMTLLCLL